MVFSFFSSSSESKQSQNPDVKISLYDSVMTAYNAGQKREEYSNLDSETIIAAVRAAETTTLPSGEGRVINAKGKEFVVTKDEYGLNIYRFDKKQPLQPISENPYCRVDRLFSLRDGRWTEAFKRAHPRKPPIEQEVKILQKVNPYGQIPGCMKPPILVKNETTDSKTVIGVLSQGFHSNALVASKDGGIIAAIRNDPNAEIYFLDIVRQALSVLARCNATQVLHGDLNTCNFLVSRREDGFFDFVVCDWEDARYSPKQNEIQEDIRKAAWSLYKIITNDWSLPSIPRSERDLARFPKPIFEKELAALPTDLREVMSQMFLAEFNNVKAERLLTELNQKLAQKADAADASPIWKNANLRACYDDHDRPSHSACSSGMNSRSS